MIAKVIEGTWEEIQRLSSELAGHQVRVQVMDTVVEQPDTSQQSADEWIRSYCEWSEGHDKTIPLLSDESISRESIYGDR